MFYPSELRRLFLNLFQLSPEPVCAFGLVATHDHDTHGAFRQQGIIKETEKHIRLEQTLARAQDQQVISALFKLFKDSVNGVIRHNEFEFQIIGC